MEYLTDKLKRKIADRAFQSPHAFLLLDYDGTLTPIVAKPELARMLESTRRLLARIVKQNGFSVGIITGRTIREMEALVHLKKLIYAGNHGLELKGPGFKYTHAKAKESIRIMKDVRTALRPLQAAFPGAMVEDKHLTLSFHYRQVPFVKLSSLKEQFDRLIAPWVGDRKIQIQEAKKVWEIRPHLNWNKGSAVRWILLHEDPASLPIYIGDDKPDESAFKALKDRGITVRVGLAPTSQAQYYVKDTNEVERFLSFFIR